MKYIKKTRSLDMFGQKINLNFNNEGEEFNSPQGTFVSILILIIVLVYTGVRFEVLILKSESNVSSVNQPVDVVNDAGNLLLN